MAVSSSSSSLLKWLLDPKKNVLAAMHKSSMDKRLRKYGLRFDDLYDPMEDLDIKEALNRLPREIVDARNQRLKRAIDLSMKHEYLPEDLQRESSRNKEIDNPTQIIKVTIEGYGIEGKGLKRQKWEMRSKQKEEKRRYPKTLASLASRPRPEAQKSTHLPELLEWVSPDPLAMQTPFRSYIQDMLALVKREREEREALGALPLYQRSIP
ncbi:hypothetical protein Cgig2_027548 [Carnegiea gigantea]|uniref:Complex III subunit VII n=1 Tax=Carnegiea gigantea TaxID=171969 RepID=A0A9Q1Q7I9_9CARY|nr:hypothetical protein Cgig2_027548 [Carnegiea gigantea]